jgi:hypothetical protein
MYVSGGRALLRLESATDGMSAQHDWGGGGVLDGVWHENKVRQAMTTYR